MGIVIRNSGQGGRVKFTSLGLGGGFNASISGTTQQQGGGGGEGASLLLDTYTDAAVAFSLRKLRTNYNGSAIRVRRTSDNTEQDIGFVNNQLDTSSLQSFVGGTNLLTYSEDFSVWATNLSATINSNVTTDPLGGNTADRLNFGSSANSEVYLQPISWQSTTYNISIYAKSDSTNKFRLKIWNGVTATFSSDITTTSTWTRYNFSLTVNSGVGNFGISNISAGGAGSVFIWGAQISVSSLQPYQVTAGSAITTNRDGFITRWYDQSGNAVISSQTVASQQPRIVNSGNVESHGGKPSMWFIPGSNNALTTTTNVSVGSYMSTFIVSKMDETTGGYKYVVNIGPSQPSSGFYAIIFKAGGGFQDWTANDALAFGAGYSVGPRIISNGNVYNNIYALTSVFLGSANTGYYVNGSAITTKALTQGNSDSANTSNTLIIGYRGSTDVYDGYLSEIIIYRSNQFSNKAGIETNINSNYSIY